MFINYQLIGKRIKEVRRARGISQEVLAERSGLSAQYVSQIETAVRQASLRSLVNIANVLEVSVDALLYGNRTMDYAEYRGEVEALLGDCTAYEKRVLFEIVTEAKRILKENRRLLDRRYTEARLR
ncbi:helix-turn-helix transcriptional regulator [Lachnospiraceae bacterium MD335]|nr:helix-turn-helix transcriptional regulator [Lachnospiraceae bacterium MD335]